MSIWHRHLDGIHAFYVNGMLRNLVFALVGIFTPVFLYTLGLELWGETVYGVLLVALYYILDRLITLLSVVPISWIIERIGFRKSIAISLVLLAIHLGSLLLAEHHTWLVVVAAVAAGLNVPFYWVARSSAVAQDAEASQVGRQTGIMNTIQQATGLLAPIAAGLMIQQWGFPSLYALALVILSTSIIPLWGMPPHVHRNGASWRGFWLWLTDRRYFHIGVGVGAQAIDSYAITVLWPLAIFVMGIKTGVLGGIFSVVAVVSLSVRMIMAKVFDRLHDKRDWSDELLHSISACVNSITWIIRLFVGSVGGILMLDMSASVFGTIYSSLYANYELLGGKRMGSIAYWVYVEMVYSIMTIGLFACVAIGAWLGIWREVFMIMASFWVLVSIVMARESNL